MRFIPRSAFLSLVAVLATSVVSASAAFANTGPEIINSKGQAPQLKKFTSKGSGGIIKFGSFTIKCSQSSATAEWSGTTTAKGEVITLRGCESAKGTCEKPVKGKNDTVSGTITTAALKGELGTVAGAEAASEVGLLMEPESRELWFELAHNECTEEAKVTGTLACEVTPREKLQSTDILECLPHEGHQKIKKIEGSTTHAIVKPRLFFNAYEMYLEASLENVFEEPLKVVL